MYSFEQINDVSQLIVLGRGKTGEYKLSTASYDRALAAAAFCDESKSVETVIFSGGYSAHTDLGGTEWRISEAALMADWADLSARVDTILEENSVNTTENILFSAGLCEPGRTIGIMAHRAQLRRGLIIAKRILPDETIIGIPAEEFGARSEGLLTAMTEAAQVVLTRGLLLGVRSGDVSNVYSRSEQERQVKQIAGSGLKRLCRATRLPIPQRYK